MDGDGLLSFQRRVSSYSAVGGEDGLPYGVMFNATEDSTTQKSITWFSNASASEKQSISYAVSGTDQWKTVEADSVLRTFSKGENSAVLVNQVTLTGLQSGTTYDYRVGGGTVWSETDTFTTLSSKDAPVSFFVLGDIQADDTTNISLIMDKLKAGNYQFGIQTGDAVDDATDYYDWVDILDLFGTENMGNVDMIHVLGNHEYAGDATAATASAVYNLPMTKAGSYYSVTYGNVYMAVINYTGTGSQLSEALDWMVEDAKASKATWKVLLMHQPAYYTNGIGGNGEIYNAVPDAAEEAGINVVFSGHDHALARTNQLRDDQIDEEDGILYYIAGSSGEKAYSITSQNVFDYSTIFKLATQDFTATYLTATADSDSMTINIWDLDRGLMDTVTLYSACVRKGHTQVYDPATGYTVCTVCGTESGDYTGEIDDAEGNGYYLINGKLQTGWVAIGAETCYFAPSTGMKEQVTKSTDVPSTCTVTGYYVLTSASGAARRYSYAAAPGHEYVEAEDGSFVCSVCGHVRVELSDCTITLPFTTATYTGSKKVPYPTVIAPDGTQLTGSGVDFYVNYADNVDVGTATVTVRAKSGYNTNLTDFRGDYGGVVELHFDILPTQPTDVTAVTTDEAGTVALSWTGSSSADAYLIYQSANGGTTWKKVGETSNTGYTVTGLDAHAAYQFRIRSTAEVNGKTYYASGYTAPVEVTTNAGIDLSNFTVTQTWKSTTYSGAAKTYGAASLKVTDPSGNVLKRNTDYTLSYENNVNAGTATVTITGAGKYEGTITAQFTITAQSLTNSGATAQGADATFDPAGAATTLTVQDKNGLTLTENVDYRVTYSDNQGIGVASAKITGMGNYKGALSTTFTILPKDISGETAAIDQAAPLTYTGAALSPAVAISGLKEGVDFTVAYENNVAAGKAKAIITGIGNYTGKQTVGFTIQQADLAKATVTDGSTYSYTGSDITPDLNVVDANGVLLAEGVDYKVDALQNNREVGTATVTIIGMGNYAGTVSHEFAIQSADIASFGVSLKPETFVYSGAERKPAVTVTDADGKTLEQDKDYTVAYADNKTSGTATVTITGMGNYVGTIERKFTIAPADLSACSVTLSYTTTTFSGGEKKPAVTVKTAKGTTLKKGTNYTVTYSDNRNAGTATVTVTGVGNYAGTVTKTFTIKPRDITACTAAADSGKTVQVDGITVPSVTVTTAAGTVLKNGLNYSVSYASGEDGITATITGMGNYTGTITLTEGMSSMDDCTAKLSFTLATYSGTAKRPAVTVTDASGRKLTGGGKDYSVVYENNVEIGTATVTITGKGQYFGTKTLTFRIRPSAPTGVAVAAVKKTTAKITFHRDESADKYYIYVNGSYVGCALTVDYYTIKNLSADTSYQVTVKAVKVVDGKNYISAASSSVTVHTK
jgi:hypothetical protein